MLKIIQLSTALLLFFGSLAVVPFNFIEKGNTYMANKNYTLAIEIFEQALEDQEILKDDAKRELVTKQLAIAHIKLKNYLMGELYLEELIIAGSQDPEVIFIYAQTQQVQKRYAKAASLYKAWGDVSDKEIEANQYAAFCTKLSKGEVNSSIQVTSLEFNSPIYADYSPFIHPDGHLVFTSDRPLSSASQVEIAGGYGANIFSAQNIDATQQGDAKKVSALNYGIYNQGVASYTSSGKTVFFTGNIEKKQKIFSLEEKQFTLGIYTANFDGFKWSKPELVNLFPDEFNTAYPAISNDGKTLYFSSDVSTGTGGYDLYVSHLTSDGWNTPTNLGSNINTSGNEVFPMQKDMVDGKVLYFSTDGRPGYGGLDIFRSTMMNGSFDLPTPIESPINSSNDDFGIYISSGSGFGYFSSNRDGSDDIYYFSTLAEGQVLTNKEKGGAIAKTAVKDLDPPVDTVYVEIPIIDTIYIPEHSKNKEVNTSYIDTDELSGYYIIFCSLRDFKRLDIYRNKNYPDALIIKGKEGFYLLSYVLSEGKYESNKLFKQESKKYKQSWFYKAGTKFYK
ncbi:MAG: hypothetical protein COA58_00240 [Bacteroidetes bacterium]|nr:MAG: hypothetical protein COA58_00240 [Bacteroidota bacterium]